MPMHGVDLNALTSKLVKLELTSQLSAELAGYLFQVFDAKSGTVGLESFLARCVCLFAEGGSLAHPFSFVVVVRSCLPKLKNSCVREV